MASEYKTRIFKSGNSLALRLPKGLGVDEGQEFRLVRDDVGRIFAHPIGGDMTLADLFGSFSADFMPDGRVPSDAPERAWDDEDSIRQSAA